MRFNAGNCFLYSSAAVANLLGFIAGLAYSWSSPVLPKLNDEKQLGNNPLGRPLTSSEESWVVGLLSLGAILGPIFSGFISDRIGRKKTLLILACPIFLSFLVLAFANTIIIFYVARFIKGIGVGGVYMILPIYLTEIAEDHNRGRLGCLMGVFITTGLLFAYAVGPYLSIQMFCITCLIPLVIFFPLFIKWNPESPQYLVMHNKQNELKICLSQLRNKSIDDVQKEVLAINKATRHLSQNTGIFKRFFSSKSSLRGLRVTLGLTILQQFAGINAVLSYMQSIFDATGSGLSPEISTVIIGIIQVLATIATSSLADKLGRRILLLTSTIGSGLSLVSLGVYFYLLDQQFEIDSLGWLPVSSLILFIISFNFGLASVPWTVMAELFPPDVKAIALTLTTVMCFIGAFIITLCFPSLSLFLGMAQSFWVFAGVCAIGVIFVYWKVPETKGRSLQEIVGLLEAKT